MYSCETSAADLIGGSPCAGKGPVEFFGVEWEVSCCTGDLCNDPTSAGIRRYRHFTLHLHPKPLSSFPLLHASPFAPWGDAVFVLQCGSNVPPVRPGRIGFPIAVPGPRRSVRDGDVGCGASLFLRDLCSSLDRWKPVRRQGACRVLGAGVGDELLHREAMQRPDFSRYQTLNPKPVTLPYTYTPNLSPFLLQCRGEQVQEPRRTGWLTDLRKQRSVLMRRRADTEKDQQDPGVGRTDLRVLHVLLR